MRYPALWVTCSALGLALCGPAHAGSPGCDDPTRTVSTGGPQIGACHQFDGNPTGCVTAYHTTGVDGGGAIASCFYNAQTDECNGCGPWNETELACANTCVPSLCGDPSRTLNAGGPGTAACTQLNGDQARCEMAYHIDRNGVATSCFYDAGSCIGCGPGDGVFPGNATSGLCTNTCVPSPCDDPSRTRNTGGPETGACHALNGDPAGCAEAFHTTGETGAGVVASCFYNAQTDECDGCGPWNEAEILCTNSCVPGCSDPSRTVHLGGSSLVVSNFFACGHFDDDQAGCEASYHTTQDGELASCWFSPAGECLGCGSPNEDGGFCTNACALEPGAEIPMAPPYALILFGTLLLGTSFWMLRGRLRSRI